VENVMIKVTLEDNQTLATLTQVDALAKQLSGTTIRMKVDLSGLENLNKDMVKALEQQAKIATAQAKTVQLQSQEQKLAQQIVLQREKTATAAEKTKQMQEQSFAQVQKTLQSEQKTAAIEQQRALLAERMAAAYDKIAMKSSAATTGTNTTAIQDRINSMVGIGSTVKSAQDSANYFSSVLSKLGEYTTTLNTSVTNGIADMTRYIQSLNGMSDAQVKATGYTKIGNDTFQTYTATVKNADGSFQNYVYSVNTATGATYQLEKGITSVDNAAVHTGDTFTSLIGKIVKWGATTTLVYAPIRMFREAVQEMKAVDTEMVTIQKVTGATTAEMEKLAASAYDVAAAYGSTASNYLNSVSAFAKAGYSDLSDALGQLAMKTQVVGDVDQETANQFLLSVDAAYKYKGSIEQLSAVLDGANEIGNKYATDVQKIAEGLGIVSSVAANANISIGELTSALGTITAVTQRSGSEAARALRALILNILGETSITLDEDSDETWTAEEIQAMADALQKFNIATRETVDGVEKLRNPMEVIRDIALQWKEGLITEVDLNDLVSDLGGKLRSNQLMALIQNFDMYESMVQDFANSAGSADKEFGIYMDSWEAKLNQLSAAWTKFVASFGIEDFIKDLISFGTTLLDVASNDVVVTTTKILALGLAVNSFSSALPAVTKAVEALKMTSVISSFKTFGSILQTAGVSLSSLQFAFTSLTTTMLASPLFWGITAGILIFALPQLIETSAEKCERLNEELEQTNEEIASLETERDQLEALDELTEKEQKRLDLINAQIKAKEILAQQQQKDTYEAYSDTLDEAYSTGVESDGTIVALTKRSDLADMIQEYYDLDEAIANLDSTQGDNLDTLEEYETRQSEIIDSVAEVIDELTGYKDALGTLEPEDEALLQALLDLINAFYGSRDAADNDTDSINGNTAATEENTNAKKDAATILSDLKDRYNILKTAEDEVNESGIVSADTLETLLTEYPELADYLVQTADGYTLTKGALDDYIESQRSEYEIALNDAKAAAISILDAEGQKQVSINSTTEAIKAQLVAMAALYQTQFINRRIEQGDSYGDAYRSWNTGSSDEYGLAKSALDAISRIENAQASLKEFDTVVGNLSRSTEKTASSASKAADETDKELERLEGIVDLRKSELDLMQARGDSVEDQIAKMREIQSALQDEIAYLRSIGAEQTEINALSTEYYELNNDINDLLEDQAEELQKKQEEAWSALEDYVDDLLDKARDAADDQIDALDDQIQKQEELRDAALSAIDDQIDALKEQKETEDEQLTLEEKRLAVEKARLDLINAQNERTVRQIQADGSWKWVADASAVKSAEDALEEAEDALKEYEKELAYNALIDNLEKEKETVEEHYNAIIADLERQQEAIEEQYQAFEEQWDSIKASIEEPAGDIADILTDIAQNGTPSMQQAISDVTSMLNSLSAYIASMTKATASGSGTSGIDDILSSLLGSSGNGLFITTDGTYDANRNYLDEAIKAAESGNLDAAKEEWIKRGYKISAEGDDRGTSQLEAWQMIMDAYNQSGAGSSGSSSSGGNGGYGSRDDFNSAIQDAFDQAQSSGDKVYIGDSGLYIDPSKIKSYDSGGIASGKGLLSKDVNDQEMVLDPETTKMILTPESNAQFIKFVKSLGILFGVSENHSDGGMQAAAVASSDRHDVTYFINGVKIGSDMANRPLSEILSVLPLHTENN
jgi:TP901 family phage tail tape measure protein